MISDVARIKNARANNKIPMLCFLSLYQDMNLKANIKSKAPVTKLLIYVTNNKDIVEYFDKSNI
jgi:hypothetical protein